jgi:hypothetical protein
MLSQPDIALLLTTNQVAAARLAGFAMTDRQVAAEAPGASRSLEFPIPPRYNRRCICAMKCSPKMAGICRSRTKTSVHAVHADSGVNYQSPAFSILIAPAYDASVTAYKFPQFETHSLSR